MNTKIGLSWEWMGLGLKEGQGGEGEEFLTRWSDQCDVLVVLNGCRSCTMLSEPGWC